MIRLWFNDGERKVRSQTHIEGHHDDALEHHPARLVALEPAGEPGPEHRRHDEGHVAVEVGGELLQLGEGGQQRRGAGARQRGDEDRILLGDALGGAAEHAVLHLGRGELHPRTGEGQPVDQAVERRIAL